METMKKPKGNFRSLVLGGTLALVVPVLQSSGGVVTPPWEKENVSFPMLNMEIRHQMEEHERQKTLTTLGRESLALEAHNTKEWEEVENTSEEIQSRLYSLQILAQMLPTALALSEKAERISRNQTLLLEELKEFPFGIPFALEEQVDFVEEMEMLLRYVAGLIASYGTLGTMEPTDRKILLDFALEEAHKLESTSLILLYRVRERREKLTLKTKLITSYINRDKALVRSLLSQLKT